MFAILLPLLLLTPVLGQNCVFNASVPNSPAIFTENFTFPSSAEIKRETLFYVLCPKGTFHPLISEAGDLALCKGGTAFIHVPSVELVNFEDIACQPIPPTTIQKTDVACGNDSVNIHIGFKIKGYFIPEVTVCFNERKMLSFYASYTNTGNSYSLNSDDYEKRICGSESRPCIFVDGANTFGEVKMDFLYLDQAKIFENLDVKVQDTLVKVPLASGAFFNEFPQQLPTYAYWDYINVMPMWNNSFPYWSRYYRDILEHQPDVVYSGTLGVAVAPNVYKEPTQLYLHGDQIPVPKWFWMVNDYRNRITFVYNSLENVEDDAKEICSRYFQDTSYLVHCGFEDVIDPEMVAFLENYPSN